MHVVIGLGKTGVSCVRWLRAQGMPVRAMDTRTQPPGIDAVCREFPGLEIHVGGLREDWLRDAGTLVVSPGISVKEPPIAEAAARGADVVGDIELFARHLRKVGKRSRVVGITGSNGKSTVTALVGEMAAAAGLNVAVGGNFGTPALDLFKGNVDMYVLELSSFQLETTHSLSLDCGTVLNVCEDHMDRYGSLAEYALSKQRIFAHCALAAVNRDDPWSAPRGGYAGNIVTFGGGPAESGLGIALVDGRRTITRDAQPLMSVDEMRIKGTHNQLNAMAALALGEGAGLPRQAMLSALRTFGGLPHRCRFVAEIRGVAWYNDSKGTNIGATAAALSGLGENIGGRIVLIAGGQGKEQDFNLLDPHVRNHVRHVVLIGQDAGLIRAALGEKEKLSDAASMEEAVGIAGRLAQPGDVVLLSPACASFDMYSGYEARGVHFEKLVAEMAGRAA